MRVAVVTCRVLPEPDPDQEPLLEALARAGLDPALLPWDDPEHTPAGFDLCVLRSCWNYYRRPQEFLAWIARADALTRLANPAAAVRWNLHKRYLAELERDGLPIVPTLFAQRGERVSFADALARAGWDDVVIKPAVSAASFSTRRFARADAAAAQPFLDALLAERDVLIQRYMPAVETRGEKALVWIDGAWTHAVRKSPRFAGADESVSAALALEPAERALADRVLTALPRATRGLLYARLDLIPSDDGAPVISELELIEPSLFLVQAPAALDRLVSALARS